MAQERQDGNCGNPPMPREIGSKWTTFIQHQIQTMFQAAIPHIVQQIVDQMNVIAQHGSPSISKGAGSSAPYGSGGPRDSELEAKELKVVEPKKFAGKKSNEVCWWFAQLCLVY